VEDASYEDNAPSLILRGFLPQVDLVTPKVDVRYAVEDSDMQFWHEELPSELWDFIASLKVGLEKASNALLLAHKKSTAKWIITGRDLHALEVRMNKDSDILGQHQSPSRVMASNVWDGLAQLSKLAAKAYHEAAMQRAEMKKLQDKLATLDLINNAGAREISALTEDLCLTQDCANSALEMVDALQETGSAGSNTPNSGHKDSNLNADAHLGHELVKAQFGHDIACLKTNLATLRSRKNRPGDGSVMSSLIKGINTQDNVDAWLIHNKFGGGKDSDPSKCISTQLQVREPILLSMEVSVIFSFYLLHLRMTNRRPPRENL
jgi:hypothetical protein